MCDCEVCTYARRVQEKIEALPEEHREFFKEMYDSLVHAEMDRDYYGAIVDGSWPGAKEILSCYWNVDETFTTR